ncbi:MAG: LptE family protein [Bacteroidia bacterium]
MRKIVYIWFLFGAILLSGCKACSYSLSGINIPPDVKSISIQYFENNATYINPSLSQKFTELLKDKFLKETSLNIKNNNGDFRLSGFIIDYKTEPVATNGNTGAVKNRFSMTVNAKFECPTHKDMDFTETITKFQEFNASESFQSIENRLSEEVSNQIIQEIFNKVALKW